jgi:hypothetical protein
MAVSALLLPLAPRPSQGVDVRLGVLAILLMGIGELVGGLVPAGYWPSGLPTQIAVEVKSALWGIAIGLVAGSIWTRRQIDKAARSVAPGDDSRLQET